MKKALVLIGLFGLLLGLCVPAQAAINLLWDIPTDLDEDAYVRAVENASGVPLVLDEEYGNYSGYLSPDGRDITLFNAPAQLRVGFEAGALVSATLGVNTTQFLQGGTGAQAVTALLDYQQTLVEALSAEFGAPTGGYMQTNAGSLQAVSYDITIWDYPGKQDGQLNRGQMAAVIDAEWRVIISVFWDNVELQVSWDDRFWNDPNGLVPTSAHVNYVFGGDWQEPNSKGFTWGKRYPGGEDWMGKSIESAPASAPFDFWGDIPAGMSKEDYILLVESEMGVEMVLKSDTPNRTTYASNGEADLELYGVPASLSILFLQGQLPSAEIIINRDAFRRGEGESQLRESMDEAAYTASTGELTF